MLNKNYKEYKIILNEEVFDEQSCDLITKCFSNFGKIY